MIVGVPKEIKDNEYRVAMIPGGVRQLADTGHQVWVETGAGEGSGFADGEYEAAGAKIVPTNAEAPRWWSKSRNPNPANTNSCGLTWCCLPICTWPPRSV